MHRDPTNRCCGLLAASPHAFVTKVDSAWHNVPDAAEFNKTAFADLCGLRRQFVSLTPDNSTSSTGVVLLPRRPIIA